MQLLELPTFVRLILELAPTCVRLMLKLAPHLFKLCDKVLLVFRMLLIVFRMFLLVLRVLLGELGYQLLLPPHLPPQHFQPLLVPAIPFILHTHTLLFLFFDMFIVRYTTIYQYIVRGRRGLVQQGRGRAGTHAPQELEHGRGTTCTHAAGAHGAGTCAPHPQEH